MLLVAWTRMKFHQKEICAASLSPIAPSFLSFLTDTHNHAVRLGNRDLLEDADATIVPAFGLAHSRLALLVEKARLVHVHRWNTQIVNDRFASFYHSYLEQIFHEIFIKSYSFKKSSLPNSIFLYWIRRFNLVLSK